MIKHLILFTILAANCISLTAQTVKTGVLVIGNTAGGISASIQSARSGAHTVFLPQASAINAELNAEDLSYLKKIRDHYKPKDSTSQAAGDTIFDLNMGKEQYLKLISDITDTTKNLTVILNTGIQSIKKKGRDWDIRLKNGQRVRADVIVDATSDLTLAATLNIDPTKTITSISQPANPFDVKSYRTVVALAYSTDANNTRAVSPVPLGAFIPTGQENFISVPQRSANLRMVNMSVGQAAGTIAAYCAFFKTTTNSINIRVVQGELFAFDAELLPLSDIKPDNPNYHAFQRMAVSGLLKPEIIKDNDHSYMYFDTLSTVSTEELRLPMREFYSRSQIWFADHDAEAMTIEDAISLFMFTAARGEELKREIEQGWKESFKFSSEFDLKRQISRGEFAVLADRYLQPFNVRVDFAGNLLS
jgi:hypothetical protein